MQFVHICNIVYPLYFCAEIVKSRRGMSLPADNDLYSVIALAVREVNLFRTERAMSAKPIVQSLSHLHQRQAPNWSRARPARVQCASISQHARIAVQTAPRISGSMIPIFLILCGKKTARSIYILESSELKHKHTGGVELYLEARKVMEDCHLQCTGVTHDTITSDI